MKTDRLREIAIKLIDACKTVEHVEIYKSDDGGGIVEIDGVMFDFDENGCVETVDNMG